MGISLKWSNFLYSGKIFRGTTDTLSVHTLKAVVSTTRQVIRLEKVVQKNFSLIFVEIIDDTSSLESTLVSLSHWAALLWMTELPKTSSLQAPVEYMQLLTRSVMPEWIPQAKWKSHYRNKQKFFLLSKVDPEDQEIWSAGCIKTLLAWLRPTLQVALSCPLESYWN